MFSDSKYSKLSAYGNAKFPHYSRVIMERISGAKAPTSGATAPTSRAEEADVPTSCCGVDVHNLTAQNIVKVNVEPSLKVSANFAGKMPQGAHTHNEDGLWASPTEKTYKIMEEQKQGPFDKALGEYIEKMYAPTRWDTSAPKVDPSGLAFEQLILKWVIESSVSAKKLTKIVPGWNIKCDDDFANALNGTYNFNEKRWRKTLLKYGGKIGIFRYKQRLKTTIYEANEFAKANIDMCLNPSVTTYQCKDTNASKFGIIALVLKILDQSTGRNGVCLELDKLCIPMVIELRRALYDIAYALSEAPDIFGLAIKLLEIFNPFISEQQENEHKMTYYSTIILNPQLSSRIAASNNSVRPQQEIWLKAMRDTYDSYARHIISHKDEDVIPLFKHIRALAAQMGAGKTTVAAIGTGPIQYQANQLLRLAEIDGCIVTVIVEPSLKVSANFAGKMPKGAHTYMIVNNRVVSMRDSAPIVLTGIKKKPERYITHGDFSFYHGQKGRNKELFGLSILEQFDWFFSWEKNFASKIIKPTRADKRSAKMTMKPSRAGYAKPTHIFCDPKSATELFGFKDELRKRGIYLLGMIDEVVACADCGEATREDNPLAYWYAKLATQVETGWFLSASYSHTNFDHIEVLPSVEDAVSFTQLQLHSGEYVTPLNGLADLSKKERLAAVDAWSPRVLRLFPPTLVPAMTKMMRKPFKVYSYDLKSSVTYLDMVRRLCKAIIEDENADQICTFMDWKPIIQPKKKTDSVLNIYTGNPAVAALELLGSHAITPEKIEAEKADYEKEVDIRIEDLKRKKTENARLAKRKKTENDRSEKNRETGLIKMSTNDIDEQIAQLIQSKSRLGDRTYIFQTPFGGTTITGANLDKLQRMPRQDIALALSGIEFDSLAFSPELEKICRDIKISNSRCEFVGVSNVYGVNDSSIQKVIIRGDPTNLGRESVCQAAGRTARSFDGRSQIGIMAISEAVLKVFADTTSIMDHFSKNIELVLSNAAVKIQSNFRGYLERKFHIEVWHSAAVHIQRLYRDYMDRKRLAISHVVISIQKIARGYITRKRLQYVSAVTSIQKIVRGFIVRADIARIRSQREYRARLLATDPQFRRYEEQRERRRVSAVSSCRAAEDGDNGTMSVRASEDSWTRVGRARPEPTHREPPRITGFIDRWISERGIGFVRVDGRQRNLYVSLRNIQDGYIPIRGEEVSCTVFTGKRGDEAGDLRPVRYTGTIRSWDAKVAYGFIIMDDPDYRGDLFIPIKNIRGYDHRTRTSEYVPRRNDRVECGRITRTVRGEQRFEAYELVQM